MEQVLDTVCRCFGAAPGTTSSSRNLNSPKSPGSRGQGNQSPEIKVRTSRLELQDREWDALFQHEAKPKQQKPLKYHHSANPDLEHAKAVAQAKLVASQPARRSQQRKSTKRKSPATRRDEIFRSRRFDPPRKPPEAPQGNSFSRFLSNHPSVVNALCFATPIRDEDDDPVPLNEHDDDSTLNTCEDTVSSTLIFDSRFSHLVEKRPPMPLFPHFKVSEEENHIRRIVATDSHNSLNLIRLMDQSRDQVQLQDSSSDEDETPVAPQAPQVLRHHIPRTSYTSPRRSCEDDLPPEPVKINSSGSSKGTASTAPSSSSSPFPDEGRVEHL